ncbi:MAG TPA: hypothetical protein VLH39_05935, partial [Magnetospirillaceae bacterium]|nr:hypothetical protein [Magnetospirillaceae bacterium]
MRRTGAFQGIEPDGGFLGVERGLLLAIRGARAGVERRTVAAGGKADIGQGGIQPEDAEFWVGHVQYCTLAPLSARYGPREPVSRKPFRMYTRPGSKRGASAVYTDHSEPAFLPLP